MTQTAQRAPVTIPEAPASAGHSRWPGLFWRWAPAVLPALAMLVVGRFRLRQPTLGWDENATWIASQRTPGQIVDLARHFDGVISPYYLVMHFWTAVFGDSEFALRAPSLLAVAAGVGVAGELGRRLFSPGVGTMSIQTMLKIARNHSQAECGSVTTMAARVSMRKLALHFGREAASTAIRPDPGRTHFKK